MTIKFIRGEDVKFTDEQFTNALIAEGWEVEEKPEVKKEVKKEGK